MICPECNDTIAECRCDHLAIPRLIEKTIGTLFVRGIKPVDIIYRILDASEVYYARMPDGWMLYGRSVLDLQNVIDQTYPHSRIEYHSC